MSVNLIRVSPHRSKKGRIQRAVLGLLLTKNRNGEIPTNGRFVFYELKQQGQVRKSAVSGGGPAARAGRYRLPGSPSEHAEASDWSSRVC